MFSKSIVTVSLIAGGIAVAGMAAATWMTPSWAQVPGHGPRIKSGRSQDVSEVQTTNLKQIALAFHNYISANVQFPAMATYGPDGLPTLSWRVALLPYLDEQELYRQFRQEEPWDSPHNKALVARMPAVFETPVSSAPPGQTRIRGYAGKGTLFDGQRVIRISDITDGTSNTLLVAVADEATPWTKPGELPFVPGRRLPALDERDPNGYQITLVDGSVRSLAFQDGTLLPHIITRAGGEVIQWTPVRPPTGATTVVTAPTLLPTPPVVPSAAPGGAGMAGVSGMTPIQALEQRMQKMEEKLELILRRLDAAGLERRR